MRTGPRMSCFTRKARSAAVLSMALLPLAGNTVLAQALECGKKRQVGTTALNEVSWKQLNDIYQQVGNKHYDEAENQLQKMLARAGKSTYLRSVLNQSLAQVEWARENYDPALEYFEKAVELDALPDQAHFSLMYQIAQLYYAKERYPEALGQLELWFCKSPGDRITPSAYALKASIHAQQEHYREALQAIEIAIGMDDDPNELWYQFMLASHYQLDQYAEAAETLEFIITRWPEKKTYWTQLSQIYFKLKRDEKALAVAALAYRRDLLDKQTDIRYLSNLYGNSQLPFYAARVLEKGIKDGIVEPTRKHWVAVAESWYAAEELEHSLAAYEYAGKASMNGKIDLRRGYILVELERWQQALNALNEALGKGGLTEGQTGEAHLLRGMSRFKLGSFDRAGTDWGIAGRYQATSDAARQWLNHLHEERRRLEP